jgi:hypothetical protein
MLSGWRASEWSGSGCGNGKALGLEEEVGTLQWYRDSSFYFCCFGF